MAKSFDRTNRDGISRLKCIFVKFFLTTFLGGNGPLRTLHRVIDAFVGRLTFNSVQLSVNSARQP